MSDGESKCTFLASFPPIQSAIKTSGGGDGMRIQLDIPESQMGNALDLLTMRQKRLRVTIEIVKDDDDTRKPRKTKF